MLDPALKKSLDQLAAVMKKVNEESEELNATISALEESLVELNPGITTWSANPLRVDEHSEAFARCSQLGFTKVSTGGNWGLWVRRGMCTRAGEGWEPIEDPQWKLVRLTDATREERAAALRQFQPLVEALTQAARDHLETLAKANRAAR